MTAENGGKKNIPLYLCCIDLTKAYDSVDLTVLCPCSLWRATENAYRHPPIPRDVQACVRLDYGEFADKFDVGQGLRQGCVLASLLFNIFPTAVLRAAEKRFLAVQASWTTWCSSNERRIGRRRAYHAQANSVGGEGEEVQRLRGVLYADDAGIVSRS